MSVVKHGLETHLYAMRQIIRFAYTKDLKQKQISWSFDGFIFPSDTSNKETQINLVRSMLSEAICNDEIIIENWKTIIVSKNIIEERLRISSGPKFKELVSRYGDSMKSIMHGSSRVYQNSLRFEIQAGLFYTYIVQRHKDGLYINPIRINIYGKDGPKDFDGLVILLGMEYNINNNKDFFVLPINNDTVSVRMSPEFLKELMATFGKEMNQKVPLEEHVSLTVIEPKSLGAEYYWLAVDNDFENKIQFDKHATNWRILYQLAKDGFMSLGDDAVTKEKNRKGLHNLHNADKFKKLFGDTASVLEVIDKKTIEWKDDVKHQYITERQMNGRIKKTKS